MKVQIFTAQLMNKPGHEENTTEVQKIAVSTLQKQINDFLEKHPTATIQWLQHSAACVYGSFTQLTAIVSH